MDVAVLLQLSPKELQQLNACRLYLSVVMLSDIVTADGKQILANIWKGERTPFRNSTFIWPMSQHPSEWGPWQKILHHLSSPR
jgi:hypothetical protein